MPLNVKLVTDFFRINKHMVDQNNRGFSVVSQQTRATQGDS